MDEIHVTGKASLSGEIFIQGSKNAALPMIAASLMHRGLSILRGCPRISDVFCMEEILKSLGAVTWWDDHDLYLDCSCADGTEIPAVYTGRMRSSIILAGAVLARNRKCRIGYPGGCTIGKRPIDFHLMALRALGADVRENASGLDGECVRFEGQDIVFPKSSVGAAQQAILAAVLAKGVTHLYNCAKEPEVFWLCRYLKTMGALIEGELDSFLEVYRKIGGQYQVNGGTLEVNGKNAVRPAVLVETEIYPGFPTDLQAPLMAVLTGAQGQSTIRENIFDRRFGSAFQMKKMGADISVSGNQAIIRGGKTLKGTQVQAGDLRGGAALLIAALMAEGETCVTGAGFISRGYEHICEDLRTLGCRIWQPGTEDLRIYERK